MRSKNVLSLFVLLTLTVTLPQVARAFETDYEECLFHVFVMHDDEVKKASDKLSSDLNDCLRFPIEQGYEQCRSVSEKTYQNELDKQKSILVQRKRACLKMPWITF